MVWVPFLFVAVVIIVVRGSRDKLLSFLTTITITTNHDYHDLPVALPIKTG